MTAHVRNRALIIRFYSLQCPTPSRAFIVKSFPVTNPESVQAYALRIFDPGPRSRSELGKPVQSEIFVTSRHSSLSRVTARHVHVLRVKT